MTQAHEEGDIADPGSAADMARSLLLADCLGSQRRSQRKQKSREATEAGRKGGRVRFRQKEGGKGESTEWMWRGISEQGKRKF